MSEEEVKELMREANKEKNKKKTRNKGKAENLVNLNTLSEEERKRIAKMGGLASVEARKKKRELRELTQSFLMQDAVGGIKANLEKLGFDKNDMTNLAAIVGICFTKAINSGDLNAARTIIEWAGMAPMQQIKENELVAKLEQFKTLNNGTEDEEANDVLIYLPDDGRDPDYVEVVDSVNDEK